MSEIATYKNAILDYLRAEKAAYENDIESHKSLSDEEEKAWEEEILAKFPLINEYIEHE